MLRPSHASSLWNAGVSRRQPGDAGVSACILGGCRGSRRQLELPAYAVAPVLRVSSGCQGAAAEGCGLWLRAAGGITCVCAGSSGSCQRTRRYMRPCERWHYGPAEGVPPSPHGSSSATASGVSQDRPPVPARAPGCEPVCEPGWPVRSVEPGCEPGWPVKPVSPVGPVAGSRSEGSWCGFALGGPASGWGEVAG